MIENDINSNHFYFNLFEKNSIPPIYKSVSFKDHNFYINEDGAFKIEKTKLHSYQYVPDYLNLTIRKDLKSSTVFQKYGYAANFHNIDSVESYISKYCKSNFRGNVRRPLKRLESCLNVNYKMFCGTIDYGEYSYLMKLFHDMLKKRFEQRNDENTVLENWDYYLKTAFEQINKKTASLFVMRNDDTPIAFSLNFHFNTVFYFAIPTFDLDYSKFTLGNTVIYKNLEWCINNGFRLFDMGYGGFENKLNWCNTTYNFNHHIIYHPKNQLGRLYALILKSKYKLINYLISKNINTRINNFKNSIKGNEKRVLFVAYKSSEIENFDALNTKALLKIDFTTEDYKYLRKPVYDFLYLNTEHVNNIVTYKLLNETDMYVIKGKKSQIKIELTN